jgi:hypothetical protein
MLTARGVQLCGMLVGLCSGSAGATLGLYFGALFGLTVLEGDYASGEFDRSAGDALR